MSLRPQSCPCCPRPVSETEIGGALLRTLIASAERFYRLERLGLVVVCKNDVAIKMYQRGIIYLTPSIFRHFWCAAKGLRDVQEHDFDLSAFRMFPDQETARVYLEGRLWPNGPRCPVCGLGERDYGPQGRLLPLQPMQRRLHVRTGTIFERSHVPLHKWIYAMYLLVTARKGISSMQLAKEIGITQKSAWFVLHRLREACGIEVRKTSRHHRD